MFSQRKPRVGAALAVIALSVTAVGLASGDGGSGVSPASAQGATAHPLDSYPGFGSSPAASSRDDSIAAWEAFRKERHIAGCMRDAGFSYEAEVTYPIDELRRIADVLNLVDAPDLSRSPEEVNDRTRTELPAERRDPYYLALYGETAAAVDRFEASGGMTDDEDFATGGCTGAAEQAIGSVWAVNRQLQPQLEAIGRASGSDAAGAYSACAQPEAGFAASNPGDIEERLENPDLPALERARLSAALTTCMPVWERAFRQARQERLRTLVSDHAAVLEATKSRYADAMQAIQADSEFLEFLAVHG